MSIKFTQASGSKTIDLTGKTGIRFTTQSGDTKDVTITGKTSLRMTRHNGDYEDIALPAVPPTNFSPKSAYYLFVSGKVTLTATGGTTPYTWSIVGSSFSMISASISTVSNQGVLTSTYIGALPQWGGAINVFETGKVRVTGGNGAYYEDDVYITHDFVIDGGPIVL